MTMEMLLQVAHRGIANTANAAVMEITRVGQVGVVSAVLAIKVVLNGASTGKALSADMTEKAIAFGKIE